MTNESCAISFSIFVKGLATLSMSSKLSSSNELHRIPKVIKYIYEAAELNACVEEFIL